MSDTPEPDISALYCPTCSHPHGYHDRERGCTMPLEASGLPATSTAATARSCRCGESNEHKMDRLTRARDAAHAAWVKAVDEQVAFALELHDAQPLAAPETVTSGP